MAITISHATDNLTNLLIPDRFNNYSRTPPIHTRVAKELGFVAEEKYYDINQDSKPDVLEVRPIVNIFPGGYLKTEHPLLYGFDIDGNNIFSLDELFIDEDMDGDYSNAKPLTGKEV
jgi:hypothetical protein